MTIKMEAFVAKQMRNNAAKKLIIETAKKNPAIADARKEDRELTREMKKQGKEYHRETSEWY